MEERLFQRSRYSERLRLTAADLENQQAYDDRKRRLINCALVGRGVVYGLKIRYDASRCGVLVSPGLAIDASGREIFVPKHAFFPLHSLFCRRPDDEDGWQICIRYDERECGEGHVLQPDGTHRAVPNRVAEGYRILAARCPLDEEICLARLLIVLDDDALYVRSLIPEAVPSDPLFRRSATGVLRISGVSGSDDENVRYSAEVAHGLGAGEVQLTIAVEGYEQQRRCEVSGTEELFYTGLQTAVKLFPDSGTFVTAVRARGGFRGDLALRWHARMIDVAPGRCKPSAQDTPGQTRGGQPLWLEPPIALLNPGERAQFFVCAPDGAHSDLRPRFIVESGGGSIDDSGRYTAPQTPGIYQIRADLGDDPESCLCASAMVFEGV